MTRVRKVDDRGVVPEYKSIAKKFYYANFPNKNYCVSNYKST